VANYALIARINAGDGKFPFVSGQFSKNHRPIPIEATTYYPSERRRGVLHSPASLPSKKRHITNNDLRHFRERVRRARNSQSEHNE